MAKHGADTMPHRGTLQHPWITLCRCTEKIANLLKEKKTVVMIAHTLSIVKNADQILVVSDGKIAEAGTHDELLAKGGKYAAMWNAEQKLSA